MPIEINRLENQKAKLIKDYDFLKEKVKSQESRLDSISDKVEEGEAKIQLAKAMAPLTEGLKIQTQIG